MQHEYKAKIIEKEAQEYWKKNNSFVVTEIQQKKNITAYLCCLTLQEGFIWDMSVTIA